MASDYETILAAVVDMCPNQADNDAARAVLAGAMSVQAARNLIWRRCSPAIPSWFGLLVALPLQWREYGAQERHELISTAAAAVADYYMDMLPVGSAEARARRGAEFERRESAAIATFSAMI